VDKTPLKGLLFEESKLLIASVEAINALMKIPSENWWGGR